MGIKLYSKDTKQKIIINKKDILITFLNYFITNIDELHILTRKNKTIRENLEKEELTKNLLSLFEMVNDKYIITNFYFCPGKTGVDLTKEFEFLGCEIGNIETVIKLLIEEPFCRKTISNHQLLRDIHVNNCDVLYVTNKYGEIFGICCFINTVNIYIHSICAKIKGINVGNLLIEKLIEISKIKNTTLVLHAMSSDIIEWYKTKGFKLERHNRMIYSKDSAKGKRRKGRKSRKKK